MHLYGCKALVLPPTPNRGITKLSDGIHERVFKKFNFQKKIYRQQKKYA